jgi:hypothetical protein
MNSQQPPSEIGPSATANLTGSTLTAFPPLHGIDSEAMCSSSGEGEEGDATTPRSSHAGCGSCCGTLHELANSVTAVLINAQVLEWKLPPYSRLKRAVREIERHAQRSGGLLKRLLGQCEAAQETDQQLCGQVPCLHPTLAAVTGQRPEGSAPGLANPPALAQATPAPDVCFSPENELTSLCDPCTSTFFPKEER